ncbi:hypothetical protein [Flammeovirga aprica]|uniref:DUF4384 domain-containing protein n=1 Tax=Flammeovirga aprica JL-4 TaxID=694437 RepID=A0A7X9X9V6_9BACT|nr:hypothetical protein [Flammeovirga aprica]NME69073.1 hypothetical protein [Flammeovirga aprica JL-4]
MKKILFATFFISLTINIFAQKVKKLKGKVTEQLEDTHTVGEFKETLLRKAQIMALADAFGTNLSSASDLTLNNAAMELQSLNTSTVKGEWIKTEYVEYTWHLAVENEKQVIYLECNVEGKGRAIDTPELNFKASTLNCSTPKCETTMFKEMSHFYTYFQSPKNGFISIYMRENDKVYRLFPYSTMHSDASKPYAVNADQEYIFFDPKKAENFEGISSRQVDELVLSTMGPKRIFNRLYVIYCPTEYDKPILKTEEGGIKTISPEDFQEWLALQKTNKKGFQEKVIYFSIEK